MIDIHEMLEDELKRNNTGDGYGTGNGYGYGNGYGTNV